MKANEYVKFRCGIYTAETPEVRARALGDIIEHMLIETSKLISARNATRVDARYSCITEVNNKFLKFRKLAIEYASRDDLSIKLAADLDIESEIPPTAFMDMAESYFGEAIVCIGRERAEKSRERRDKLLSDAL